MYTNSRDERLWLEESNKNKKRLKKKLGSSSVELFRFQFFFLLKGNNIKSDRLWVDLKKG